MSFFFTLSAIKISGSETGLPTSTTTIGQGLANIITILMQVIGSASVIMIIVGGLLYALSAGDPGRIKRARDTVTYAVAGLIVSIVAYAIVSFVAASLK